MNLDIQTKIYELENWHISLMRTKNSKGAPIEKIIQKMENLDLGRVEISSIELSERGNYEENS